MYILLYIEKIQPTIWGKRKKERCILLYIYREIQSTAIILLYIDKLTSGEKEKEKRFSYIEKYNKIYIEKTQITSGGKKEKRDVYFSIYRKNTPLIKLLFLYIYRKTL